MADRHGDARLAGVVADHNFYRHGVSGGNALRDQDVDLPHSMNEPRDPPRGYTLYGTDSSPAS